MLARSFLFISIMIEMIIHLIPLEIMWGLRRIYGYMNGRIMMRVVNFMDVVSGLLYCEFSHITIDCVWLFGSEGLLR